MFHPYLTSEKYHIYILFVHADTFLFQILMFYSNCTLDIENIMASR